MPKGQTPALKPEQAERYREVVRLKSAGFTFDEIASRVGYASRSGAKEAYDAALRWWGRESVDQMRTIEGERLNELWRRTFGRILSNPEETREFVALVQTAVRISNSRASLYGLEAPKQIEVSGQDGGPIEIDVAHILVERIREMGNIDLSSVIDAEAT